MRVENIEQKGLPTTGYVTQPLLRTAMLLNGYLSNEEYTFGANTIKYFWKLGRKVDLERHGEIEQFYLARMANEYQIIGHGRKRKFEWDKIEPGESFNKARRVSLMLPKNVNLMDVTICLWIDRYASLLDKEICIKVESPDGLFFHIDVVDLRTPVTTVIDFKHYNRTYHIDVHGTRNHKINRLRKSSYGVTCRVNPQLVQDAAVKSDNIMKRISVFESLSGNFSSDNGKFTIVSEEPEF